MKKSDKSSLNVAIEDSPAVSQTRYADMAVRCPSAGQARICSFVNDAPAQIEVNGMVAADDSGVPIEAQGGLLKVRVPLVPGRNQVDIYIESAESTGLPETREIYCEQPIVKPKLYVAAIGINYSDSSFPLHFADADAKSITASLNNQPIFSSADQLLLVDGAATKDSILKIKEWLSRAKQEDTVVLFLAGHGMVDLKSRTFYFAPSDMDFDAPSEKGIQYDQIEGLLNGVWAQNKLLLIDCCHSGEIDPAGGTAAARQQSGARTPNVHGRIPLSEAIDLASEVFQNLERGTGAQVIAASTGAQSAFERNGHGVFTSCVLEALSTPDLAKRKDGLLMVDDLRAFVEKQVPAITHGQQTPTTRRESVEFDFPVARAGSDQRSVNKIPKK